MRLLIASTLACLVTIASGPTQGQGKKDKKDAEPIRLTAKDYPVPGDEDYKQQWAAFKAKFSKGTKVHVAGYFLYKAYSGGALRKIGTRIHVGETSLPNNRKVDRDVYVYWFDGPEKFIERISATKSRVELIGTVYRHDNETFMIRVDKLLRPTPAQ